MLAISSHGDERQGEFKSFPDEFSDGFSGGNLLEDIDFDDLFVGFDDGDILPDLVIDPSELFAEFSVGDEEEQATTTTAEGLATMVRDNDNSSSHGEEAMSVSMEREDSAGAPMSGSSSSSSETDRGRRKTSPGQGKGSSQGKRKVKVDWTPELHRRFVQAVEQLGVDKAVPSRILEIMGIDCLTRHNIASHLQKYRSHRKHLLAREAEAASLTQRRQMYASGAGPPAAKRNVGHTWMAPTMGFPPAPPPVPASFRPLHVWGHPSMDQSLVHVWPKHLVRAGVGAPPLPWSPPAIPHPTTPPDASYWHYYPRVPCTLTQGTPFFPQPAAMQRFSSPPVQVVLPPHPMYRPSCGPPPPSSKHFATQLPIEAHPATESIDAAIGDVLSKPWLPLPLGLKPPSLDSVMVELQRQGVSKIPPTCS